MNEPHFLSPPWSGRHGVEVYSTTRLGGFSRAPYDELNLGLHVDDDADAVQRNRQLLQQQLKLNRQPLWLRQVHGTHVVCADDDSCGEVPDADGSWTAQRGSPIAVLTADCLPVVLATGAHDRYSVERKSVAVVHAGWRGLAAGVVQNAIAALDAKRGSIAAWLGPAIGPLHFEVGAEVRDEFLRKVPGVTEDCFQDPAARDVLQKESDKSLNGEAANDASYLGSDAIAGGTVGENTGDQAAGDEVDRVGKCYADLYAIARIILANHGIEDISGGNNCTYQDQDLFFSYRRDGVKSGRMATLAVIRDN